ncbi:MAG: hypothetical protein JOZ58_10225, partial [Acetobacteraceae bacterium]|nr:hypothetical protein [Acetobacteraceae bacterium]
MRRRRLLQCAAALPALAVPAMSGLTSGATRGLVSRVSPGDPGWPAESEWESLRRSVGGDLIAVRSPLDACQAEPEGGV